MQSQVDPSFYRSPGEAVAAPPEQLAYVVLVAYGRERLAAARAKLTRPRSKP